jgi:hypothetical protein
MRRKITRAFACRSFNLIFGERTSIGFWFRLALLKPKSQFWQAASSSLIAGAKHSSMPVTRF